MFKKILIALSAASIAVTSAVSLAGCGNNNTETSSQQISAVTVKSDSTLSGSVTTSSASESSATLSATDSSATSSSAENEADIDCCSEITVDKQLKWDNGYEYHYDLIITNNSDKVLSVSCSAVFRNDENKPVGKADWNIYAIDPGEKKYVWLDCDELDFARAEVKVSAEEDEDYTKGTSDIKYEVTDASEEKQMTELTNTGTETLSGVRAFLVYYSDGKVVDMDFDWVNNNEDLKSGDSAFAETSTSEHFDKYEVYIDGYAYDQD